MAGLGVLTTITIFAAIGQTVFSHPGVDTQTQQTHVEAGRSSGIFSFRPTWGERSQARTDEPPFAKRSLEELSRRDEALDSNPDGSKFIWLLDDTYQGRMFFDNMTFFSYDDPTSGLVTYVTREQAFSRNLTYFEDDGTVVMTADTVSQLPLGQNRTSVRIETQKKYTGGLFILDVKRAPWGCGVWPAFWSTTNDNTWPYNGEIDIIEGVHDNEHNQITWHTAPGCYLDTSQNFTGTPVETPAANKTVTCDTKVNSNAGCGVTEWSRASYGPDFESQGGGVIAMKWDENGIAVWSFYRAAIPKNVVDGAPNPSTWGPPSAALGNTQCDISRYFSNHVLIFDITFCGDWAGNSYATTNCPGTCAERLMDPANFVNATWHINSLKTFKKQAIYATAPSSAPMAMPQWRSAFIVVLFSFALSSLVGITF